MSPMNRSSILRTRPTPKPQRIGLALGSGAARGLAHIGVIRALEEAGIVPDIVVGSSVGALAGAAYVAGRLDALEAWLAQLDRRKVFGFFDLTLKGGVVRGQRLFNSLYGDLADTLIESLPRPFAVVATDLVHGEERWIRSGPLVEALRASSAITGFVSPVKIDERWLVDGGLTNPLPVSLCRALGADYVIAVDLCGVLLQARFQAGKHNGASSSAKTRQEDVPPSLWDVFAAGFEIMQTQIVRTHRTQHRADLLIAPELLDFHFLDFHRSATAIAEGYRAARNALAQLPEHVPLMATKPLAAENRIVA